MLEDTKEESFISGNLIKPPVRLGPEGGAFYQRPDPDTVGKEVKPEVKQNQERSTEVNSRVQR